MTENTLVPMDSSPTVTLLLSCQDRLGMAAAVTFFRAASHGELHGSTVGGVCLFGEPQVAEGSSSVTEGGDLGGRRSGCFREVGTRQVFELDCELVGGESVERCQGVPGPLIAIGVGNEFVDQTVHCGLVDHGAKGGVDHGGRSG